MQRQARRGIRCREVRGEIAIDLDDREVLDAFEQWARERAQARPDLDHVVIRLRIERGDDALDGAAIDQEMLAEAFARGNQGHTKSRIRLDFPAGAD